jgi:archaemetzincin
MAQRLRSPQVDLGQMYLGLPPLSEGQLTAEARVKEASDMNVKSIPSNDALRLGLKLSIVPILEVDPQDITDLIALLPETLKFDEISLRPSVRDATTSCFDMKRGQYNAHGLLALASAMKREGDDLLLGVTMMDLYYPGLNFVFGLASAGGAIISLYRLRQEFYGLSPDRRLFMNRAIKEAVHEIGHVLGLGHCTSTSCVMFFSNSIFDTDAKGLRFCASCSARIAM